jgi:prophage maintenance system killer protein
MLKEVASYEAEVITNEAKVQKMRDEGKDMYGMERRVKIKYYQIWEDFLIVM